MSTKMRQLIIARKDLQMSPGKLAAQCCHASIAFITHQMRALNFSTCHRGKTIKVPVELDPEVYTDWICGIFTKTICEAKNRNQLIFLIKDACLTELEPEEIDENGVGRVLTCIGFRPLPNETIQKISRKVQL